MPSPRAEPDDAIGEPTPCEPHASAEEDLSQLLSGTAMAAGKEARASSAPYGGNYNVAIFAALTTGATVGIVLRFLSTKPWPARHVRADTRRFRKLSSVSPKAQLPVDEPIPWLR